MSFGARALIHLSALRHNLDVIRNRAAGARVMAVVKANAYGHGLGIVGQTLAGADSLAVARLSEALELRKAGIEMPIVLLSGVYSPDELALASQHHLELVVHSDLQVTLLEDGKYRPLTVWLKVDTGMRRLGFEPEEGASLIARMRASANIAELRLMTHLASADDRQDATSHAQLNAFASVARDFDGDVSIANSAGLFAWPASVRPDYVARARCVWVRPGIALYGISPFPEQNGADLGLRPVMQFESCLLAVKPIRKGQPVGYGGRWRARHDTTLGIMAAGYGDGFTRYLASGTPVLVNGRPVPLAGTISMDMAAVDLGPDARDRIGDRVLLWGDALPVEETARRAGAFAYQLVCGVMHRAAAGVAGATGE